MVKEESDTNCRQIESGVEVNRVAPEAALSMISQHNGPVVVDFDETLFLRNSTEEFIDTAVPAAAAKLLIQALEILKPWRAIGGETARDNYRILLITIFFPWTWLLWKERAQHLASQFSNQDLTIALSKHKDVAVSSLGFTRIIAPLINAMKLKECKLVACGILTPSERRQGKLLLLSKRFERGHLESAMVITDSEDDAPLLAASAKGVLVTWPSAMYRPALLEVYLPFLYVSRVKRPGERYFWRGIVQDDFSFWVLATLPMASQPIWHLAGLSCLFVSFWAIYETGYVDNDRIAARCEASPRLSNAFFERPVKTPSISPWYWSACFGGIGLSLLGGGQMPDVTDVISWLALLASVCATFWAFNRTPKTMRPLVYPVLQGFRVGSFAVVTSAAPGAVGGLCAAIASSWIGYAAYRQSGGAKWPDMPLATMRIAGTVVFSALIFAVIPTTSMDITIAGMFIVWSALRARGELKVLLNSVRK